jgi:hypothetical protein
LHHEKLPTESPNKKKKTPSTGEILVLLGATDIRKVETVLGESYAKNPLMGRRISIFQKTFVITLLMSLKLRVLHCK